MSSLSSIYIKRETLKTLLDVLGKKDLPGIELTISTNDDSNEWGQNISAYVAQTKEERESGKNKYYVGNGKVFWTDGTVKVGEKKTNTQPQQETPQNEPKGLPF